MRPAVLLFGFIVSAFFAAGAYAAAVFELVSGDVRAGPAADRTATIQTRQRVATGTVVTTGPKSTTILRFDDGQALALTENSEVRIAEYAFVQAEPAKDRSVFDLVKGAMRSVSGAIAQRSPAAYSVRAPQATIGIRGTDYMLGLVNPAYFSVLNGTIAVTNAAGTAAFTAGATGMVASAATLATSIAATALPASISTAFSQLGALPMAGAAATGAGAGTSAGASAAGAAAGGLGVGAISAIAAAVAAAVAVTSSDDAAVAPTGTTGTTGTSGTR